MKSKYGKYYRPWFGVTKTGSLSYCGSRSGIYSKSWVTSDIDDNPKSWSRSGICNSGSSSGEDSDYKSGSGSR